jgi:hypothetical protein
MGDVELAIGRATAEFAGQLEAVGLRQHAGHRRVGSRIVAQLQDLGARRRVIDIIMARRRFRDRVGVLAIPERGARFLHGTEPGLLDELIEPPRR